MPLASVDCTSAGLLWGLCWQWDCSGHGDREEGTEGGALGTKPSPNLDTEVCTPTPEVRRRREINGLQRLVEPVWEEGEKSLGMKYRKGQAGGARAAGVNLAAWT